MSHCSHISRALSASLRLSVVLLFAFLVFCTAQSIKAQSVNGYQAPEKALTPEQLLPDSVKAERGLAPLGRLYGHLVVEAAKVRRLPVLDPSEEKKAARDRVLRIGAVRPLPLPLNPISDSTTYTVAEGDVQVAAVVSEGALFTRLHFTNMSLPKGARVFVYSQSKPDEYYGPYQDHGDSADGTFWTPRLTGDTVVIEYIAAPGSKSQETPFQISEVSHTFKDVFDPNDPALSCNQPVDPAWATVASSVGLIDFIDDTFGETLCTGTLLNDSASDGIPYFLTANHCINSRSEAQSSIVFWNYDNVGDDPPPGVQTTVGANLLSTGTTSDYTLLRLTGSLPGGLFFSGWDAGFISPSIPVKGIHHPNGSHKRMSTGNTNSLCDPTPCGNFAGVTWTSGITEFGSSGSGIWTGSPSNAKLVGSLSAGDDPSCSPPSVHDFYGRFSVTFQSISPFLSSCVTSLSPASQNFAAAGGSGSITVNSGACNWQAVSTASFVNITSSLTGTGNGTVTFSVAANNGWTRSASIIIGSQVFVINQARSGSAGCTPAAINYGQTVNRTLTSVSQNCVMADGTLADPYTFNAVAGQQVAISMNSGQFDTYLYLLNPDGSTLTTNDDVNVGSPGTELEFAL